MVASVVKKATDVTGKNSNLPLYAGKCDMYFVLGEDGMARQGRLYKDNRAYLDFDWDHDHCNEKGDKKFFNEGTVHVQEYVYDKDENPHRLSHSARMMTEYEIEKYGPIIHKFNPNVKFK